MFPDKMRVSSFPDRFPHYVYHRGLLPRETDVFCFSGMSRSRCTGLLLYETHVSLVLMERSEEDKGACDKLPECFCPGYFIMRHMCLLFQWSMQKTIHWPSRGRHRGVWQRVLLRGLLPHEMHVSFVSVECPDDTWD